LRRSDDTLGLPPYAPRTYTIVTMPDGSKKCYCGQSSKMDQMVTSMHEAAISTFHDESLASATKEINAILDNVRSTNSDRNRELAFLLVGDGLLLAWTEDAITAFDEYEVVVEELGIRSKEGNTG
jgi:hypothetical protein